MLRRFFNLFVKRVYFFACIIVFGCVVAALNSLPGAHSIAQAPAPSATPDPFVAQITSANQESFAGDMTANGRFVVIESSGDIATEKIPSFDSNGNPNPNARNNEDGNREIFIYDYAQRRIFQITNTRPVLNPTATPTATPTPTPSPSATPTPTPSPTPIPGSSIKVEITNNRPIISLQGKLNGQGKRVYTIVFSSNAPNPQFFDGTDSDALDADANQEIWTYELPPVDDVDLTKGTDIPFQDLTTGAFTQITDTPASRAPTPGSTTQSPFVADDNREAMISDDGQIIAFASTRNLVGGDTDGNPEVFLFNRGTKAFTQVTQSQDVFTNGFLTNPIFNENPSLSSDGSVLAFVSNANLTGNNSDLSSQVYVANFDGASVSNLRQVTRTQAGTNGATVNLFSFGRRLSRDGKLLAFDSLADDPKGTSTTTQSFYAVFVYDIVGDAFTRIEPRATTAPGDVIHFPTFTDYNNNLSPGSVVFTSALNFLPDGTFPASGQDSTGLNPQRASQIFLSPPSPSAPGSGPFTRITNVPSEIIFAGIRPFPSSTRGRIAFSFAGELGGGNPTFNSQVFYHLSPADTNESNGSISLFTGASLVPVAMPVPSGSPTPTPTPFIAPGLAPAELSIAQATVDLAPSNVSVSNNSASESGRAPALPIELNGVSMAINGAACGLYFVGPSKISFVVPKGLVPNTGSANYPIVVNNNGTVIRGNVVIVAAQPDIFTTTNGPGGRALVCNVTNPLVMGCVGEPFDQISDNEPAPLWPRCWRFT